MSEPKSKKKLQRILGLFSYYAKWVPNFSEILRPLAQNKRYPLPEEATNAYQVTKNKLTEAILQPIDEAVPFTVETDASDFAVGASLNQNGKPVAFHARTFLTTKQKHSSVEKEAHML